MCPEEGKKAGERAGRKFYFGFEKPFSMKI